jgi:hypothetical protein
MSTAISRLLAGDTLHIGDFTLTRRGIMHNSTLEEAKAFPMWIDTNLGSGIIGPWVRSHYPSG